MNTRFPATVVALLTLGPYTFDVGAQLSTVALSPGIGTLSTVQPSLTAPALPVPTPAPSVVETTPAAQPPGLGGIIGTVVLSPTVTIDSFSPAQPDPNKPVAVNFTISNYTPEANSGAVDLFMDHARVHPLEGPLTVSLAPWNGGVWQTWPGQNAYTLTIPSVPAGHHTISVVWGPKLALGGGPGGFLARADEDIGVFPSYNNVYGIATHNSYWINRSDQVDFFSGGVQELISDQLLHEHVRALEIDIHSDGAPPGDWRVYHTSDSEDFLGRYLSDYLEYLRNFQYAVPQHEVVNIVIELKNSVPTNGNYLDPNGVASSFNSDHTIQQLDDLFRNYLGPWLYTPGDMLARGNADTLTAAAQNAGWPKIDELRGKFIINILGYFSTCANDWVQYATTDLPQRVAFPIKSVLAMQPDPPADAREWTEIWSGTDHFWVKDADLSFPVSRFGPLARQNAFDQCIFWDAGGIGPDLVNQQVAKFLARGGVVRSPAAFKTDSGDTSASNNSYPDVENSSNQMDQLQLGVQLLMTDYPWHVLNDDGPAGAGIPTNPGQRFRDLSWANTATGPYPEPGARFYLHTSSSAEWMAARVTVDAVSQNWWETTISTTRHGDTFTERTTRPWWSLTIPVLDDVLLSYPRRAQEDGSGAILAASPDGLNWVVIERQKSTQPGPSYYQESVVVRITVMQSGVIQPPLEFWAPRYGPCKRPEDPNSDNVSSVCVGSMVALAIENLGASSAVAAFSAGKTKPDDGTPDWQYLGQWSFNQPLVLQGFGGSGDVLFAGPRRATELQSNGLPAQEPDFTSLQDLPNQAVLTGPNSGDARMVDLSH